MEAVDDEMKYSVVNTRVYRINRIETFMVGHSGQYCLLLSLDKGRIIETLLWLFFGTVQQAKLS